MQVDLGAALGGGISQSMVSMMETGRNVPSLARATDIARALGVSLDYLAGLTDDPTPAEQLSRELSEATGRPPRRF